MKKILIAFVLVAVFSVSALFSDEVSAIWSRLYSRARGYEDRIMIMKGLVEIDEESIIPFLGSALQELNEARANEMSVTQNMQHIELTKLIVRRLGEFKSADFSDLMFDVYKNTADVYLRAETVLALGRTVDPSYSDDIAIFLRNLNLNIGAESTDKDSEVLALAAVLAIERFRQPVGFNSLFFASIGWYSKLSTVREQAARALDTLVEDPTPILNDLVRLETDHAVKLEALEAEGRSKAPAEGKAAVAAEAIRQGLVNEPANQAAKSILARLRQRGLELLITHGPAETGVEKYLEEIIYRQFDINEQLTAVLALETDGRTEAVAVLVRFLMIQNNRQISGLTPADYRVIRSVIKTLGNIGDQTAFEELTAVKISNWPSSVVRDANEAIGKLK
jgi:hypothetical protein